MNPIQRHRPTIAVFSLLFLLYSHSALAFRCGQKIVIKNMHELQVRKACGEPTTQRNLGVTVRSGHLPERRSYANGVTVERFPGYGHYVEEVVLTEYVYNFGPRKFMRRLIFEGGILVTIESMGYGYREKKPG